MYFVKRWKGEGAVGNFPKNGCMYGFKKERPPASPFFFFARHPRLTLSAVPVTAAKLRSVPAFFRRFPFSSASVKVSPAVLLLSPTCSSGGITAHLSRYIFPVCFLVLIFSKSGLVRTGSDLTFFFHVTSFTRHTPLPSDELPLPSGDLLLLQRSPLFPIYSGKLLFLVLFRCLEQLDQKLCSSFF